MGGTFVGGIGKQRINNSSEIHIKKMRTKAYTILAESKSVQHIKQHVLAYLIRERERIYLKSPEERRQKQLHMCSG